MGEKIDDDLEKISFNYLEKKKKIETELDKLKEMSDSEKKFSDSKVDSIPTYLEALEVEKCEAEIELAILENDIIKLNEFKQSAIAILALSFTALGITVPGFFNLLKTIFDEFSKVSEGVNFVPPIILSLILFGVTIISLLLIAVEIFVLLDITGIFSFRFRKNYKMRTKNNILEQRRINLKIELIKARIEDAKKRIDLDYLGDSRNSNIIMMRKYKDESMAFTEYIIAPK